MVRGGAIAVGALLLFGPASASATPDDSRLRAGLADLRVPFITNEGQVDRRVAFYATTFDGTLFVTRKGELVYSLPTPPSHDVRQGVTAVPRLRVTLTETLTGGRARPAGQDPSATRVSSFVGDDPARWRSRVATYEQVGLGEVWPGVTVSLHPRGRGVEQVFTVKPRASAARIRVRVTGAESLTVDDRGALVARTALGSVTFTAPLAYQERGGVRRAVAVRYRVTGHDYGFTPAAYDPALPLVIDPLLQSTYLGGNGDDFATALAIHPTTGEVYIAGATTSTNFPGTSGDPIFGGVQDAFIARFTASLTSLVQATYLGGSADDFATGLAIHPATGDVYVVGGTSSTNFPLTGGSPQRLNGGRRDAFVARLSAALTDLRQATYLGGGQNDFAAALAIHPATGDVYVAGLTESANFPGTPGGAQPNLGSANGTPDAFVARLSASLTSLIQATYLGGDSGDDASAIAIHPTTGDVYVAGSTASTNLPGTAGGTQPMYGSGQTDGFVARFTRSLTSLIQATYLGGSDADLATALAIHPATGDVYVAGSTRSTNLPLTGGSPQRLNAGGEDAFVARLNASLTSLTQATYLGGSGDDFVSSLAIHPTTGDVYVVGSTESPNFPGTAGAAQPTYGGGDRDGFVARLTRPLTSLTQTTFLGGNNADDAVWVSIRALTGDVYVAGGTASTGFPHAGGGAQTMLGGADDAFVSRLTFSLAAVDPTLDISASANQATFTVGQALSVAGSVTNPGLPDTADFYVGIARPDGSIQFFTNAGIVLGKVGDLTSFRPFAVGVSLGTAFSVSAPDFFSHQWTSSDQRGTYVFFVGAVKTGALAGGTLSAGALLNLATAGFTLQ